MMTIHTRRMRGGSSALALGLLAAALASNCGGPSHGQPKGEVKTGGGESPRTPLVSGLEATEVGNARFWTTHFQGKKTQRNGVLRGRGAFSIDPTVLKSVDRIEIYGASGFLRPDALTSSQPIVHIDLSG